ncbi:MAG: bifunctional (p)ppGpp synthetase/guanosine-3',5'-bis(diphosphate) 3'-pyrophosphohydrolase, partial [Clostridiales bacterium]
MKIDDLIKKVHDYNSASDSELIMSAYQLALSAHQGQLRDSGEEYICHPLAVADILADLQLDDETIIAGILHDVVEDTEISLEDIREKFGDDVVILVDGVTKLSKLEYRSRQERQAENLRKMFLAMANDIRIILIKLADRLHNMRTLKSHHSAVRQKEIAEETRTIFAPLAHRLGIFKIKNELEDLALSILEPEYFEKLKLRIEKENAQRDVVIQNICLIISESLQSMGIEADISGRSKNYYSIFNKMRSQNKDLGEIFDLTAVRVIVDSVKDCYGVLGVIHTRWKPIPGRFKDYIAMPKENMYQSIHTTVIGDDGNPFEVQIRTWAMHKTAEYGIAAHWRYKEGKSGDADFEKKVEWLRRMLEWQQEMRDAREFVESVKVDLFNDNIYVFSPQGDVYELPSGSCPVDFAYRVHTQIGHQCMGAKVNKRLVPLDHQLHNGDIVEIMITKGRGPNRDWLKLVKTQQAKNKIRQWFRKENRDENISLGRDLLEKECKKYNQDPTQLLKHDKLVEAGKKFN